MDMLFKKLCFKRVMHTACQGGRYGVHEKKRNVPFSHAIPPIPPFTNPLRYSAFSLRNALFHRMQTKSRPFFEKPGKAFHHYGENEAPPHTFPADNRIKEMGKNERSQNQKKAPVYETGAHHFKA